MLSLTLKTTSNIPVEVEGITPDTVREKSLDEIQRLEIFHGNVKTELAEFFDVAGDAGDERMELVGDLAGVHWIGTKMKSGEIHIHGDAGRHLGSEMQGGTIEVEGNTGDWVGGEMRGGQIHVKGNAGHLIGAAYRGSPVGMKGGTILIDGNAGNEIGHTMRRGLIAIGGNIGDLAAFNMRAGTVLVFGESGIRHAAGMRRGTLGFLEKKKPELLLSFRRSCRYRPEFIPILLRQIAKIGVHVPDHLFHSDFELYHGDLIEGGRGEILFAL